MMSCDETYKTSWVIELVKVLQIGNNKYRMGLHARDIFNIWDRCLWKIEVI